MVYTKWLKFNKNQFGMDLEASYKISLMSKYFKAIITMDHEMCELQDER